MKNYFLFILIFSILISCNSGNNQNNLTVNDKPNVPAENIDQPETKQETTASHPDTNQQTTRKNTSTKAGKSTENNPEKSYKSVEIKSLGLKIKIPAQMKQNGEVIEAYGRKNELLNKEIRFVSDDNNELIIKYFPRQNADKIYAYYKKQFLEKKGNFALSAEKKNINGLEFLTGISKRKFDGKGHPLNPPHYVYFAVWKDDGQLYELYFRNKKARDGNTFENILESIQKI